MFVSKKKYAKIETEKGILKKNYDELERKYFVLEIESQKLKETNDKLEKRNVEFEKIVKEDFGDSLSYLLKQWGNLAWIMELPPGKGNDFLDTIEKDIRELIKEFLRQKKKKENNKDKKIKTEEAEVNDAS